MTYEEWGKTEDLVERFLGDNKDYMSLADLHHLMYADWTADRDAQAGVYAAGMAACEEQVDEYIGRIDAAEKRGLAQKGTTHRGRFVKYADTQTVSTDPGMFAIPRDELAYQRRHRKWALEEARYWWVKAHEMLVAAEAAEKRVEKIHDQWVEAIADKHYQRRHRRWALKEARTLAWHLREDEKLSMQEGEAAEKDAAYQRRHRKWALKEMRIQRRLGRWGRLYGDEQKNHAQATEADRDKLAQRVKVYEEKYGILE